MQSNRLCLHAIKYPFIIRLLTTLSFFVFISFAFFISLIFCSYSTLLRNIFALIFFIIIMMSHITCHVIELYNFLLSFLYGFNFFHALAPCVRTPYTCMPGKGEQKKQHEKMKWISQKHLWMKKSFKFRLWKNWCLFTYVSILLAFEWMRWRLFAIFTFFLLR